MAQPHLIASHVDQTLPFGRFKILQTQMDRAKDCGQGGQSRPPADRDHEQGVLDPGRQPGQDATPRALRGQSHSHIHLACRGQGCTLGNSLQDGEGVAPGGPHDGPEDVARDRQSPDPCQRLALVEVEPAQPKGRQAARRMRYARLIPGREQYDDALGGKPAGNEGHQLPRFLIYPLQVVHEYYERLLVAHRGQRSQRSRANGQRAGRRTVGQG
jgi:hypothetical protein